MPRGSKRSKSGRIRAQRGIPDGITREDVEAALRRLAAGAPHAFGPSKRWGVIYGGHRFAPKAVLALAAEQRAGRTLGPADFQRGQDSRCNRILIELGFPPVPKTSGAVATKDEIEDAIQEEIEQRTDVGPIEKLDLVKSRRGQGVYRENLEKIERCCRVTGVLDRRQLRASHIKPWYECDDREKLDGSNGLLLSPHVDHLFERGYISFSDTGELLVSRSLNPEVLRSWGITVPCNVGSFRPEQCRYLDYHRKTVFEKGRGGGGRTDDNATEVDAPVLRTSR